MRLKTHAKLMKRINLVWPIVGIPVYFILIIQAASNKNVVPLLVFVIFIITLNIILWNLPVRCEDPCCRGVVEKTKTYLSAFEVRLNYRCTVCNSFYESTVFELLPGEPPT
jgi:hypothetical protein